MKKSLLVLAVCAVTFGLTNVSFATLTNGGFESGNFTGWTLTGSGGVQTSVPTVGVKEGSYTGRIEAPTTVGGLTTLSQTLSLNAGDTLEGWYSLRNSNRFAAYPTYGSIEGDDDYSSSLWEQTTGYSPVFGAWTSPWTYWSWEAPVSGTYTLQFGINNPSGQYGGVVYLDGISLSTIPEPATLALLGLGGLFFRKIKRA